MRLEPVGIHRRGVRWREDRKVVADQKLLTSTRCLLRIYRLYVGVAVGRSPQTIALQLNADGLRGSQRKAWGRRRSTAVCISVSGLGAMLEGVRRLVLQNRQRCRGRATCNSDAGRCSKR
jgi:hypothetical protein